MPHSENMGARLLDGWLPTDVSFGETGAVVEWLRLSPADITEELFVQTIRKARSSGDGSSVHSDLDGLFELAGTKRTVEPSGLVFDLSHCGAARVAAALRKRGNSLVLFNAPVISAAFRP